MLLPLKTLLRVVATRITENAHGRERDGWKVENQRLVPLWFTCDRVPSNLYYEDHEESTEDDPESSDDDDDDGYDESDSDDANDN